MARHAHNSMQMHIYDNMLSRHSYIAYGASKPEKFSGPQAHVTGDGESHFSRCAHLSFATCQVKVLTLKSFDGNFTPCKKNEKLRAACRGATFSSVFHHITDYRTALP